MSGRWFCPMVWKTGCKGDGWTELRDTLCDKCKPIETQPPKGYRMLAAVLHQQIKEGDTVAEAAVREIEKLRRENKAQYAIYANEVIKLKEEIESLNRERQVHKLLDISSNTRIKKLREGKEQALNRALDYAMAIDKLDEQNRRLREENERVNRLYSHALARIEVKDMALKLDKEK